MSISLSAAAFWLAVACCLVAQVALLWAAIRAPMPGTPQTGSMPMPRRGSEIGWTILPAIGLVVLLVFTWRAVHRPPATPPDAHAGHTIPTG